MKLNLFDNAKGVVDHMLHPKFKLLRDNPLLEGERKILESWTEGFVDRDNKIIKEFQTSFHSSFWEFYLFRFFKEMGFTIDFSKNRPDFIISSPKPMYVEAVVSNIKETGIKEVQRNAHDILSMLDPPHLQSDFDTILAEAITRHSNAIHGKYKKFKSGYSNDEWVSNDVQFAIALASYDQINYGREFYYPLMALLYGQVFNPIKKQFEFCEKIIKPDTDSEIPLGLFRDSSMDTVSGILFTCTVTLGKLTSLSKSINNSTLNMNQVLNIRHDHEFPHYKIQDVSETNPEELSDGLFLFHNPFAKKPLSQNAFDNSNVLHVIADNKGVLFEGNNSPIVSRVNIPKMIMPDTLKEQLIKETIYRFNF